MVSFAKKNDYNLWIASSMGQAAIERGSYIQEIFLVSQKDFLEALNLNSENYKFLPAMYPDINIECKNQKANDEICSKIKLLLDSSNKQIITIRYKPRSSSINLIINTSENLVKDFHLFFENKKSFSMIWGLELFKRDSGTDTTSRRAYY